MTLKTPADHAVSRGLVFLGLSGVLESDSEIVPQRAQRRTTEGHRGER
jgi:hypothetical protein